MLFPYTFVVLHEPPKGAAFVSVSGFADDEAGILFNAWNRAENVYGPDSVAVRAVWGRYLGTHAVAVYVATSNADAERQALMTDLPELVRAAFACLALGKPLGEDNDDRPGNDGGTKARLSRPKPVRPSGGNAVPVQTAADMLGL